MATITRYTLSQQATDYGGTRAVDALVDYTHLSAFDPEEIYRVERSPTGEYICEAKSQGNTYLLTQAQLDGLINQIGGERAQRIRDRVYAYAPVFIRIRDKMAKAVAANIPDYNNYLFPPDFILDEVVLGDGTNRDDNPEMDWWYHNTNGEIL